MLWKVSGIEGVVFELLDEVFPLDEEHVREDFAKSFFQHILGDKKVTVKEITTFCIGEKITIRGMGKLSHHRQKNVVLFEKEGKIMIVPENGLGQKEKKELLNFFRKKG